MVVSVRVDGRVWGNTVVCICWSSGGETYILAVVVVMGSDMGWFL